MNWGAWPLRVIDILVVAFLFYRLFLLIRGTRAAQMIIGLLTIVVLSIVAEWAELRTLNWFLSSLKTVWIIAFIILFQPELRRALAQIGQYRVFSRFVSTEAYGIVGHVVRACEAMSQKRVGGIIVIEQGVGLKNFLETGTRLNSNVSQELLLSIFNTRSPLHDGAVIIRGDQITAARCILPLSHRRHPGRAFGTRHRAAIGLSEETDAVIIIVSEQTGWISIAADGKLTRMKDAAELRSYLSQVLGIKEKKEKPSPRFRDIFGRGGLQGSRR